jgi:biotin carboxyl carrier protein
MYRKLMRNTTMALGTLLMGSSLVMAAGFQGVVTGVDSKGMATVRTSDNKEHQVKVGEGLRLNDLRVECETKQNAMACRPVHTQAAVTPAPSTAAPAKQAPAKAPMTSTPAPSSSTAAPAASAPAPSPATPATGSK